MDVCERVTPYIVSLTATPAGTPICTDCYKRPTFHPLGLCRTCFRKHYGRDDAHPLPAWDIATPNGLAAGDRHHDQSA